MNECVCGKIISANKVRCRECNEITGKDIIDMILPNEDGE